MVVTRTTVIDNRFWSKVRKTETCWLWTAFTDGDGYGTFRLNRRSYRAHRLAYEDAKGQIPEGLVIDHLCRVRNCVNPDHLEAVTSVENVMRGDTLGARNRDKSHCDKGHEFTDENTGRQSSKTPKRYCLQCERDRNKARRAYLTNYMREYRQRSKV